MDDAGVPWRAARSVTAFLAAPRGCYVEGGTYVVWCASATLAGACHWGRLDAPVMAEMLPFLDLPHSPGMAPPFDFVTDGQDVTGWEEGAAALLLEALARRRDLLPRTIRRQAIVLAPGLPGTVMAGIHQLVGSRYELRWETERAAALDWLVAEPTRGQVIALIDRIRGVDPLLRRARAAIQRELGSATVASVAAVLSMSPRTLQRELTVRRTSFRRELQRIRVATAERLLADGPEKIESVARAVGCSSGSHLARLMRQHLGRLPSGVAGRKPR